MYWKNKWCAGLAVMLLGLTAVPGGAYEANDKILSVGAILSPVELGSDWGEVNVEDLSRYMAHDAKLGEPGVGFEVQAFYFLNPHVAVGVDLSHEWFLKEVSSGWYVNGWTHQQRYMLASRIYANPEAPYKVYLALGGGVALTKMTMEFTTEESFKDTGFGYYAGLGVEKKWGKHWGLGLEARYNGNDFDVSRRVGNNDLVHIYRQANFLSAVLQVNYQL